MNGINDFYYWTYCKVHDQIKYFRHVWQVGLFSLMDFVNQEFWKSFQNFVCYRRSLAAQQRARAKEALSQTKTLQTSMAAGKKALQVRWKFTAHSVIHKLNYLHHCYYYLLLLLLLLYIDLYVSLIHVHAALSSIRKECMAYSADQVPDTYHVMRRSTIW